MQAPFELTEGKQSLEAIISEFPPESPHWNEAQNRFQFVDRLLTECLGWEQPDIEVERRDDAGGIADYLLGKNKAVLETKREAIAWSILPKANPNKLYKISSQMAACKNFSAAVNQIIPYCAMNGAPLAIICNGPQLAIFLALTQGIKPTEGYCYIFNGFGSYLDDFAHLWALLSPEAISENRAYRRLSDRQNIRIPAKASDHIPEPRKFRYRNALEEELRQVGAFLLEEIEDNPELRPEFYRECYVPIEANNRHLLLSKQVISSRYSRVATDDENPASLDSATKTGRISDQAFIGSGSRPIVVIGDVGVGKSSFFENLFLSLSPSEREQTIYLTIDLGRSATLTEDIKEHIVFSLPEELNAKYQIDIEEAEFVEAIYHAELERFDRTLEGQDKETDPATYKIARRKFLLDKIQRREAHLRQSLSHLAAGRKKRVIVVIDNADQRTFEVQQEAFLVAQEIASMRTVDVFVALRPSTFYLSKMTGALSAYQNKILTISPPPADEVIKKRLMFALRVAEGNAAHGALEGIRLNLTSIVLFMRALLRSIRSVERIRQFLGNITGGNTKAVIEMITSFVGSPNVESSKIIRIEEAQGDYIVPYHEFTKHALLGEYSYYNPESSLVACNLFDVSASDTNEHFLRPLIASFCSSTSAFRDKDGFFPGESIFEEMEKLGFGERQIGAAIKVLANKKLIETPYSHYRELSVDEGADPRTFAFRVTSVGLYHVRFWMGEFSYLDAMAIDTPIFQPRERNIVAKYASSFEIDLRYRKATAFRDYLKACWQKADFRTSYFDFEAVLQLRDDEFQKVERVINGQNARRSR